MTLEHFWTKQHETMPSSKRKNVKLDQQAMDTSASVPVQHGEQDIDNSSNPSEPELEPGLAKAFEEMTKKILLQISEKLDPLAKTVASHTTELTRANERLDEAEARILQLEAATEPLAAKTQALEEKVRAFADHIDDLENRGRRKNICIFNIPEDTEGVNAPGFFEHWLPTFLGVDMKGGRVKLERAHRSLAPKPGDGQRPRPVIVRFHSFPDKQRVMAAVRRKAAEGDITMGGKRIYFYNDLSAAVLRKRKEFVEAKKRLRDIGAQYSMLYPAKLQVSFNGIKKTFLSPADVLSFVSSVANQG